MDVSRGVNEDGHPVESLTVYATGGPIAPGTVFHEPGHETVRLPDWDAAAPVDEGDRYGSLSKQDLVAECGARRPPLSVAGSKADLVARLRESDAAPTEQASDEPPVEESP